ncbi:MAG: hypothetical protein ACREAU_01295 [Nitrosopumilaceae archaeon]
MPTQPKQLFVINNTQGTVTFFLPPGQVNGPGASEQNTDLKLYGLSHTMWGEGVDENFYRLTENFACPEKSLNPGNPQDESDLGFGNGINVPLNGQIWFNTTQKKLFVFDALLPGWKGISGVTSSTLAPLSPQIGDLWYDETTPQLKVFDGISFVSVAERYVLKTGDAMTGFLFLSADPMLPLHAATKQYVDTMIQPVNADLTAISTFTNETGILVRTAPSTYAFRTITTNATLTVIDGDGVLGNPQLGITAISQISGGSFSKFFVNTFGQVTHNTPVTVTDISALVDSRYVNVTGDTMTGVLSMTNKKITLLGTPTVGTDAATKAYVDTVVGPGLSGSFVNATGSRALSTTYTNSFGKDIMVIVTVGLFAGGTLSGIVSGVTVVEQQDGQTTKAHITFIVDSGATYRVQATSVGLGLLHWYEYR